MPDREKVIEALEHCTRKFEPRCAGCPYFSECAMDLSAVERDALELLRGQEAGGWISVKERLPEKSGTYLCYQPKAADICALNTVRYSTQRGWMGKEYGSRIEGIEYWMPLPEPPEEARR